MVDKNEIEEKLEIYKDRLERAMDIGNIAWWEMELPSGEVDFNDRKVEMLGYSPEKFEHYSDFTDLFHPEDHDRAMKAMRDHLEGEESRYEVEYRIEKKDGEYKWFRDVGGITEEEDGEYKKVTGVVVDIDDQKKAEEKLRESEERYRRLFETAQDGMLILDAETGEIKDANPYIQDIVGYSKEELVGKRLWELGTFRHIVENKKRFEELVKEGYIRYDDLPLETKNGEEAPVEFVSNTYQAGGEKVVQCNIRDISERKKAKKETRKRLKELNLLYTLPNLEDSKDSLEGILDNAVDLLPDSFQYPDNTCARIVFENQEYKTDNFRETEWSLTSNLLVEGKRTGFVEVFYLEEKPDEDFGPFLEEERKLLKEFTERLSSISEKTKVRDRLERSQEIASVGSWEMDLETRELTWSHETYRIFEVPIGSPVDYEKFLEFVHPEDRDFVDKKWNEALESGEYDIEHRIVVNEETKWVREKADIKFDDEEKPTEVIGIVQDITERKKAEEELGESEEKYGELFESVGVGIVIHDSDGEIISANRAAEDALGLVEEEMKEKGLDYWEGLFYNGNRETLEFSEFPVSKVFDSKKPVEEEIVGIPAEGSGGLKWYVTSAVPHFNDIGGIERVTTSFKEITKGKRSEEALQHFANSISEVSGQALFDSVVKELSDWFNVDGAFVGEIRENGETVSELSMFLNGEMIEDYEYSIQDAPCQKVVEDGASLVRENVRELFPEDEELEEMGAEGYLGVPIKNEQGESIGIIWAISKNRIEDIPPNWEELLEMIASRMSIEIQRKRIEKGLQESVRRFRKLTEVSPEAIFLIEVETGKIIEANEEVEELMKGSRRDIIGEEFMDLVSEESRKRVDDVFEEIVQEGEIVQRGDIEDIYFLDSEKNEIPVEINATVMEWGGREVIQLLTRDVSRRKKAEDKAKNFRSLLKSLREFDYLISRKSNFHEILEGATDALLETRGYIGVSIALRDEENVLSPVSQSGGHFRNNWEIDLKKLEGEPSCIKGVFESKSEKIIESVKNSQEDCEFCEYEEDHNTLLVPIKGEDKILGVLITCFDIEREVDKEEIDLLKKTGKDIVFASQKIKADKELRESKEQYEGLFNGIDAPVYVLDFKGKILSPNETAVERMGYSREEFLKMNVLDIDPSHDEEGVANRIEEVEEEGSTTFETVHRTKNGEEIPMEIRLTVIDYGGEKAVLAMCRDISERKEFRIRGILYSLLTHDLETKLKTAEGLLEVLEEKDVSPENERIINSSLLSIRNSYSLTEKVKVLQKISEEVPTKIVELDAKVREAIDSNSRLIEEKGVEVTFEPTGEEVRGSQLLEELFSDLIEESIRSEGSGKIRISSKSGEGELKIVLENDGSGVPELTREGLEKNFRDGQVKRPGLMIYLAQEIASLHGGKVELEDSDLGGTKFKITLSKHEGD